MKRENTITEIILALVLIIGAGTIFLWGVWIQDTMAGRTTVDIKPTSTSAQKK